MLLVASETGHVYTFATRKLQPMITSDAGKALIQTCLNSPDISNGNGDQRMSATGFEETDLTYTVNEENSSEKVSVGVCVSLPPFPCHLFVLKFLKLCLIVVKTCHTLSGKGQNYSDVLLLLLFTLMLTLLVQQRPRSV